MILVYTNVCFSVTLQSAGVLLVNRKMATRKRASYSVMTQATTDQQNTIDACTITVMMVSVHP